MEQQLREIVPFLRDKNPQVRHLALSTLLPQTAKDAPHRNIFLSGLQSGGLQKPKEADIIKDLKLLCRDQLAVAHDAFKALVNLTDSPLVAQMLSDSNFLNFIVSYIINPDAILADLASMLLSNLTASSGACSMIISMNVNVISDPKVKNSFYPTQSRSGSCPAPVPYPSGKASDVLALPLLLDAFVQGSQLKQTEDPSKHLRKSELHFLASVFANVASSSSGRSFFLTPRPANFLKPNDSIEYPLAKLVTFTEHKDTIRRGGVANTIKNCSFHSAGHRAMLTPEDTLAAVPPSPVEVPGIDVLPYLLLPLAGPEEFDLEDQEKLPEALQFLPSDKTREPDQVIRLAHVETLLLFCHTRWGRDYMRTHGVYEIIRATHENETVDKISEHIERLVNLLKRDEPSEQVEKVSEDLASAHIEDEDDEDSKIEEV
ncbi:hypothetical protein EV421DRAFT_2034839 [Armillaria borealis]|uniref:Protein HGH1 homolog n=1 Tax=Armillaria borealis TaxID=47425 RepID=A0AA39JMY7_9AGAR|nr:hypothetical protein EV421DRAFT_2034839 [Armillaria borealis]